MVVAENHHFLVLVIKILGHPPGAFGVASRTHLYQGPKLPKKQVQLYLTNNEHIFHHSLFFFLIISFFIVSDQFFFIEIIVFINIVSLPLASFVGVGHFLLNVFLEGLVKILTMLLVIINVDFSGKLAEGFEAMLRPSSTWQAACAPIVSQLVAIVSSILVNLGDHWQQQ
jgi:hypothetical protein